MSPSLTDAAVVDAPRPTDAAPGPSFADLGVPADLVEVLAAGGITEPFPVQVATIPDGLAGRDVCGKAPTGSGKTLAFGLPVVAGVAKARPHHPQALILAPTRELANQIKDQLIPLAGRRKRRVAAIYGGVGYGPQRTALRNGADILVACPGRLEDLLEQGALRLHEVQTVVVDEADRMADMGFLPAVKRILDLTSPDRQTILFSATLDGDVEVLTRRYQRDPSFHDVAGVEGEQGPVHHVFWRMETTERLTHTASLVDGIGSTVVFARTRHGADKITRDLGRAGVKAAALHGSRSQSQRQRALDDFAAGKVKALVATDVVARGIHVDDVACVVHYDPPADAKTYVHRSGRTARAGAAGLVVSLVGPELVGDVRLIQRDLELPFGHHRIDIDALVDGAAPVLIPDDGPAPRGAGGGASGSPRKRSGRSRGNGGGSPQGGTGNGSGARTSTNQTQSRNTRSAAPGRANGGPARGARNGQTRTSTTVRNGQDRAATTTARDGQTRTGDRPQIRSGVQDAPSRADSRGGQDRTDSRGGQDRTASGDGQSRPGKMSRWRRNSTRTAGATPNRGRSGRSKASGSST